MKKRLSLLMVLMMVLSLVPMSAFAAAGSVPGGVLSFEDTATNAGAKQVTVKLTQSAYTTINAATPGVKLTLSNGAKFTSDSANEVIFNAGNDTLKDGVTNASTTAAIRIDNVFSNVAYVNTSKIELGPNAIDILVTFKANFNELKAGDVTLTIDEMGNSDLEVADPIKVAVIKEATSDEFKMVVADSEKKISTDGGELSKVEIKDFNSAARVFKLELPDYIRWADASFSVSVDGATKTAVRDPKDLEVATITLTDSADSILLQPNVTVVKRDASMGDITLKVTATGTNTKETISEVVGQLADYDATMTAVEKGKKVIPAMYGGEESIVKVTISGVKGTFTEGRLIDFTVEGADVLSVENSATLNNKDVADLDDGEFSLDVADADLDELIFEMKIKADYAEAGEVVLTAESRDFGTLECNVAEVTPAFTVEVAKITDIKKGESLATADVVIKEAKAGILDSNQYLVLNLNDKNRETLSFSSDYTVEGTNGLKLGDGIYNEDGGTKNALSTLVIDVKSSSVKEAGVITISDVVVNVDGATVDGVKTLDVFVVETGDNYDFVTSGSEDVARESVSDKKSAVEYVNFEEPDADYEIDYVNVVKEYGTVATTTVFVIGSKTYTVNGVQMTANEAPYVAGKGYTMLPVRALAESLGLKADWNSNTKTATFSNDSKVASVTLGADTMYVNGTPIPLNAKAEIKNGSTFIELRSLAAAFNVELQWDAATKTVTIVG